MKIGLMTAGSEGDIRPFTALAAGLTKAGHDVAMVVTDVTGRDYSSLSHRSGYILKSLPSPIIQNSAEGKKIWQSIIAESNPFKQGEMMLIHGFDPIIEVMYTAAHELCIENDLVIGHFGTFPLQVAAEKYSIPMATVNLAYNCIPSKFIKPPGIPDIGRWFYPLGWKLFRLRLNRIFLPRINKLRSRKGLAPVKDVMDNVWSSERINLIAVSQYICKRPDDWSECHQVCGFMNPTVDDEKEELPARLEEFLVSSLPPVYFTFGSSMLPELNQIQETVSIWKNTVERLKCRAILQVPWDDLSVFERNNQIFMVNRSPYVTVFPRCAAIVHHGGAGTTQASLLAGKPSVVVTHMVDQYFWSKELKRLGVAGNSLKRRSLSAQKLSKEISTVLSDAAIQERATAISRALVMENGVENAIQIIERVFRNAKGM